MIYLRHFIEKTSCAFYHCQSSHKTFCIAFCYFLFFFQENRKFPKDVFYACVCCIFQRMLFCFVFVSAKFRRQDEIEEVEEDGAPTGDKNKISWTDFLAEE